MSVQSAVKELDEITREISVTIAASVVQDKFNQFLGKVQKTATFKGFRPGKAPRHLVEQVHGERIRYEVTNELITDSLTNTCRDHKLVSVGVPQIESLQQEQGKDLQYTAKLEVMPSPKVKKYTALSVKVPKREVTEKEIEQVVERLQQSRATSKPLAFRNTVAKGDIVEALVRIDIEGQESAPAEKVTIQLGEEQLPKEVEEGLTGLEVGSSKKIEITLGADHPNEKLRGKKIAYDITVQGLAEKVLPELTDDFAKGLGLDIETVLALRMKIREQLEAEHKKETKSDVQAEILNVLAADHDFKIPQSLIDDEIRALLARSGFVDTKKIDLSRINVEPFRERMGEAAAKRVKTLILVDKIAEEEKMEPTEADIEKAMGELATQNDVSIDEVRKFFLQSDRSAGFNLEIRRTKVLDWLEGMAKVEFVDPAPEQKA